MEPIEELKKVKNTGDIVLGSKETLEKIESGDAELVIISASCPAEMEDDIRKSSSDNDVSIYSYPGGSEDLGLVLGKPFLVSAMAIMDPGDSSILELGEMTDES